MRFVFINTGTLRQNAGIIRCLGFGASLARLGHDVTILLTNEDENIRRYGSFFRGIRFVYATPGHVVEQVTKLLALLRLKAVDVVHCMGGGTNIFLPALVAKRVFRRGFLLVVDYEDKQSLLVPPNRVRWQQFWERVSFEHADMIVCAGKALGDEVAARAPGKTVTIPMGFAFDKQEASFERSLPQNDAVSRLGYLGNLIPPYADQVEFLLNALPVLRKTLDGVQLHIIGDGPCRSSFQEACRSNQLVGSVIFHNYVEEARLFPLLMSMDALVFPFADRPVNRYRCPHKAFLFAQTGLPIVTNPVGEVHALLRDYPRAFFFEEESVPSFVQTVLKALDGAALPQHHGDGDLGAFYERRSWQVLAQEYLAQCQSRSSATSTMSGRD